MRYEKGDGVNPRLLLHLPVSVPADINVRFRFCFYLIFYNQMDAVFGGDAVADLRKTVQMLDNESTDGIILF